MANFWDNDAPAASNDFWSGDVPAAAPDTGPQIVPGNQTGYTPMVTAQPDVPADIAPGVGQSVWAARRNAILNGLVGGTGAILEGTGQAISGETAADAAKRKLGVLDQLDQNPNQAFDAKADPENLSGLAPEDRAAYRAAIKSSSSPSAWERIGQPIAHAGEAVTGFGDTQFPVAPEHAGDFAVMVQRGIGQFIPVVASALGGPAGIGAAALEAGAQAYKHAFEQVLEEHPGRADLAHRAATLSGLVGIGTMGVPAARLSHLAEQMVGKGLAQIVTRAATEGAVMTGLGEVQQGADNAFADRPFLTGMGDPKSMGASFATGALMAGAMGGASAGRRAVGRMMQPDAAPELRQADAALGEAARQAQSATVEAPTAAPAPTPQPEAQSPSAPVQDTPAPPSEPQPQPTQPEPAPRPAPDARDLTTIGKAYHAGALDPKVEELVRAEAARKGVDPDWMVALFRAEGGGTDRTSPAGAYGAAQLMPDTARELGVDPRNLAQNVEGGVRYFKQALDKFGGDYAAATAAYNAGPNSRAVRHFAETGDHGTLPAETKNYVATIAALAHEPGRPQLPRNRVYAGDMAIDTRPILVELGDLIASHDAEGNVNPAYPQEFQPRDRTSIPSQIQVREIASHHKPELAAPSPDAGSGAPIVAPDGKTVESGNGRLAALSLIYNDPALADRGSAYRQFLASQGYDVEGMKQPVLVSRRLTPLAGPDLMQFIETANERNTLAQTGGEQARSDADLARASIHLLRGSNLRSADNAPFVREFMKGVSAQEAGNMFNRKGEMTPHGARKIQGAIIGTAYGDALDSTLDRFTSDESEGIKNIGGAMADAAGPWAQMRVMAADGRIPPALDITADLARAAQIVDHARQNRIPVATAAEMARDDRFSPLSPTAQDFLESFFQPGMKRGVSRGAIGDRLRAYAEAAADVKPDIFGRGPTPAAVMREADTKLAKRASAGEEQLARRDGEGSAPVSIDAEPRERLEAGLRTMMRFLGLPEKVALKLVDRIERIVDGKVKGNDAVYTRGLIQIALDNPHPDLVPTKLFHEAIHALMDLDGVLTPGQKSTLERGAKLWLSRNPEARQRLEKMYPPREGEDHQGRIQNEAVAWMAEEAYRAGLEMKKPTDALVGRLMNTIRGIGQALRGQGFETAEDVFRGLLQGEHALPGSREALGQFEPQDPMLGVLAHVGMRQSEDDQPQPAAALDGDQLRDAIAQNQMPEHYAARLNDKEGLEREGQLVLPGAERRPEPPPQPLPKGKAQRGVDDLPLFGATQKEMFAARDDQTATPEFRRWFGDSKVVDRDGKPLVVYHGTANAFDAFKPDHPGAHLALPGHFFTPDPQLASGFARSSAMDKAFKNGLPVDPDAPRGAQVMPTHLSIKNPYHLDASGGSFDGHVPAALIKSMLERAKEQGHDGAIIEGWKDGSGPVQYVAFRPEQIKSAISNRGTFDDSDPRIQFAARDDSAERTSLPGLYSAVGRAVDNLKQPKGSGEQMLAAIKNTPGVKPEELAYLGLADWLRGQKSVTREQLADFVRANHLKVEEVGYGGGLPPELAEQKQKVAAEREKLRKALSERNYRDPDAVITQLESWGHLEMHQVPEELYSLATRFIDLNHEFKDAEHDHKAENGTKYDDYSTPGGENYRELLLTLPPKPVEVKLGEPTTKSRTTMGMPIETRVHDVHVDGKRAGHIEHYPFSDVPEETKRKWGLAEVPDNVTIHTHGLHGQATSIDHAIKQLTEAYGSPRHPDRIGKVYESGHWEPRNVVAHTRASDRVSPDGKHTLLVDEVQSDWHQEGRKSGYKKTIPFKELAEGHLEVQEPLHESHAWEVWTPDGYHHLATIDRAWANTPEEAIQRARETLRSSEGGIDTGTVPDAPFKTTWPMLAMKRMIAHAVERGMDRVAWPMGQVHADRYDLSRSIGRVELRDNSTGSGVIQPKMDEPFRSGRVLAFDHAGNEVHSAYVHSEEELHRTLEQTVGKEIGQRLLDAPRSARDGVRHRELTGLDLRTGGEGMRTFYDKMLPLEVTKLVGKFGAKVERGTIEYDNAKGVHDVPVHQLDITEPLRKVITEGGGFPMYAARDDEPTPLRRPANENRTRPEQRLDRMQKQAEQRRYLADAPKREAAKAEEQAKWRQDFQAEQDRKRAEREEWQAKQDKLDQAMHEAFAKIPKPGDEQASVRDNLQTAVKQGSKEARSWLRSTLDEALFPMRAGSKQAQVAAFRWAQATRGIHFRIGQINRQLRAKYDNEALAAMGRALDAESAFVQTPDGDRAAFDASKKGLAGLTADQRADLTALDTMAQQTWRRLGERGLISPGAAGIPHYMPRRLVMLGELGARRITPEDDLMHRDLLGPTKSGGRGGGLTSMDQKGRNLTDDPGIHHRENLEREGTAKAGKTRFGENATLVDDVRVLLDAIQREERAIAGRDMVDAIKKAGEDMGQTWVAEGLQPERDFFTLEHPALQRYQVAATDADGNPVWQRVPIHVHEQFRGPLNAVLRQRDPRWYQALMAVKNRQMGAIMWSPYMHLMVEVGRSLPLFKGNPIALAQSMFRARGLIADRKFMDRAIADGVVPIGQGWDKLDPVSLMNEHLDVQQKGWAAKLWNGDTAMQRWFHNWHQKHLWDNVFRLQIGIYNDMVGRYKEAGYTDRAAGVMAAHLANRYAGALPPEHLSRLANMTTNLGLFSRSFTLGNLGVVKDMLNGAPTHIRSVLEAELGAEGANKATKALRRKAFGAFVGDVGLFFVLNAAVQSAAQALRGDDVAKAYADHILPQWGNEPGKRNRAFVGLSPENRGIYGRNPVGKVGEDMLGWIVNPGKIGIDKLSPMLRSLVEVAVGKDTLGRDIYNPSPHGVLEQLGRARDIALHLVGASVPLDELKNVHDLATGQAQEPAVAAARALGPLTGLASISEGRSGDQGQTGPETATMLEAKPHDDYMHRLANEQATRLHKQGRDDEARAAINAAYPNDPRAANAVMRNILQPERRTARTIRFFNKTATDAQREAVRTVTH